MLEQLVEEKTLVVGELLTILSNNKLANPFRLLDGEMTTSDIKAHSKKLVS